MGQLQVYCSICGAPIFGWESTDGDEWLTHATVLTTGRQGASGLELDAYRRDPRGKYSCIAPPNPGGLLRLEARTDSTPNFTLESSQGQKQIRILDLEDPFDGGPLYVPVHTACLAIADRFVASVAVSLGTAATVAQDGIASETDLWQVLYKRMPSKSMTMLSVLPEPADYLGGRHCRNVYWEPDDDEAFAEMAVQHPSGPNATEAILAQLEPRDANAEPDEQRWYFQGIVNGHIFPWLWDLDPAACREKEAQAAWDWRRLAWSLAAVGRTPDEHQSSNLPLGLVNRVRIWRLLQHARIGDVAACWGAGGQPTGH